MTDIKKKTKHPGGRPRTTSFSPAEMIELGEEMIQWLRERPETLHLSQWYTIEKMFLYNEWKQFITKPEFRPYYEQGLKLVGVNYLNKDSKVRDGISQRWQRVYFKDLREEEDETARFHSSLKTEEAAVTTPEHIAKYDSLINALNKSQSSASKIEDTKTIKDQKS